MEFPEAFEPLFEGALLVFWSGTVFSVDVFGFVQVKLWKAFCAHINSLPVGLVPSGPRASGFDFRELATGGTMFRWEGDENVWDKSLTVPCVMESPCGRGG